MPFVLIYAFVLGPVGPYLFCSLIAIISTIASFLMPAVNKYIFKY